MKIALARTLRTSVFFGVAASAALAMGCTVSVHTQTKYVGTQATTLTQPWTGQAIEIENKNGSVTVTGDPNATQVTFAATPFAFADNQADGNAATADVVSTIALDTPSAVQIYGHCNLAATSHGTAANGTTGCDIVVTVPAGSLTAGVPLKVTSHNGPVTVNNVTAAAGQQIIVQSDNGTVTAQSITGGVKAHSDNGGVTALFNPTPGSNVEASTEVGDVTLSLPANFAADHITITATQGTLTSAFADVTATTTSRGTVGTGASRVVATTQLGNVTLQSH